MMRCGTVSTFYAFTTASGTTRKVVNALDLSAEGATCTGSQYVVMNQAEFDTLTASPFRLTVQEGGAISGAILLAWAAGWGIRQVTRVLTHTDTPPSHD